MVKFLVIFGFLFYVLFKLGGFFLRMFFGGTMAQRASQGQRHYQQPKPEEGNVHIDYVPEAQENKPQKKFKGGDYVDFEEVD